jgi:hypothetical protein
LDKGSNLRIGIQDTTVQDFAALTFKYITDHITFLLIAVNSKIWNLVMATTRETKVSNGTNGSPSNKRAIRIGGASGGVFDRLRSIPDFAKDPTIDVIFGDWISEISMTFRGSQKAERALGEEALSYEISFIAALAPALQDIAKNKQKVVVNAGSCDAEAMANKVQQICNDQTTGLSVYWVTGDDVTEPFKKLLAQGETFNSLPSDNPITDWGVKPICAQAYLGAMGIAEALRDGADIVICGRVADASPVIGAAVWWHNWRREDFNKLACALVAGHLIVSVILIPIDISLLIQNLGMQRLYHGRLLYWIQTGTLADE